MKTALTIIIFVIFTSRLISQSDTLNRYNDKGKKVGYWIKYLDENLKETNRAQSVYYGFDFFDNGINLSKVSRSIKKYLVIPPSELTNKPIPKLLEGVFYLKTSDGRVESIEEYRHGYPYIFRGYETNKKNNENRFESEYLNYSRNYENQQGSFYWESRSFKRQDTTRFWFRKVNGKWRDVKIGSWFNIESVLRFVIGTV